VLLVLLVHSMVTSTTVAVAVVVQRDQRAQPEPQEILEALVQLERQEMPELQVQSELREMLELRDQRDQ
jgi:hypothetical protein